MKIFSLLVDKFFKCFSLFLIAAILVFIPLRILSYGWSPDFGMLISSVLSQNSDIPPSHATIIESITSLTPLYLIVSEKTLIFLSLFTFIIFNIIGLCYTTNRMAWFASLTSLMLFDQSLIMRLTSCSPLVFISMLFITVSLAPYKMIKKHPLKSSCIIACLILFIRFILFAKIFTFSLLNVEYDFFWKNSYTELPYLYSLNSWLLLTPIVIWLASYKQKTGIIKQLDNAYLFTALYLQLAINLGYIDLVIIRDTFVIIWLATTITETIKAIKCFKELRVKYCISIFILAVFTIIASHDGDGRFSKKAIEETAIDFSQPELKSWAPGNGRTFFNDNPKFAIAQYYSYPKDNYKFYYIDANKLLDEEKLKLLKIQEDLRQYRTPIPEHYQNMLSQIKPGDRLITSAKINGINGLDWLQLRKNLWIGRPNSLFFESELSPSD